MLKKLYQKNVFFLLSLVFLLGLVVNDFVEDIEEKRSVFHFAFEGLIIFMGVVSIYTVFKDLKMELKEVKRDVTLKASELEKLQLEKQTWLDSNTNHINSLSQSIRSQFDHWRLSASEKEIALFLLKGLTTKEIAEIRSTSEVTVRQQCSSIYSKSGLRGKSDLSSFFLEDLLEV